MPWKCPDCGTINWHGAGCRLCSAEPEPEPENDRIFQVSETPSKRRETRAKLATEGQRIRGTDGNNAAVRFCRVKGNNK